MIFIIKLCENDYKDTLVTLYAIMDYILKYKSSGVPIFPFMMNENEVGAVALSDDYKELIPQIIKLKNIIKNDYDVNLIVGISSVDTNIRNINRQYQECKSVLKEIKNSRNIVVMCEDMDEDYTKDNIFAQMQSKVRKYILEGDIAGINKFLEDNLKKYTDNETLNKRNFSYCYVNALETVFAEYGYSFDDSEILSVKEIWKRLADFDSIIDINNFLENLTMSVMEYINEMNSKKSDLTSAIIKIIEKRYAEHLTVSSIAKEVNFSRKQIHRIFTQETGMSITEYITNYRIETAKQLLNENKPVDEVIFAVGYRDKAYFYEIFKEKLGMTPAQYKNICEEKNSDK